MFKKISLTAALAGILMICPAAFAQRGGHAGGSRGAAVSGRAFSGGGGRAYGGGYGGYRGYGGGGYGYARGWAGPRFGVGLGFYGPSYYPGYAAPCRGYRDRFGYWHPAVGCYAAPY